MTHLILWWKQGNSSSLHSRGASDCSPAIMKRMTKLMVVTVNLYFQTSYSLLWLSR